MKKPRSLILDYAIDEATLTVLLRMRPLERGLELEISDQIAQANQVDSSKIHSVERIYSLSKEGKSVIVEVYGDSFGELAFNSMNLMMNKTQVNRFEQPIDYCDAKLAREFLDHMSARGQESGEGTNVFGLLSKKLDEQTLAIAGAQR